MASIGAILDRTNGYGKGFNFVRIALALTVLLWHDRVFVTGNRDFFDAQYLWVLNYPIMPMFFGLSGFLVAASAQRLKLGDFFLNRFARIFPALAVEVLLAALILGPFVTSLALYDYFSDPLFRRYFLNLVGDMQYHLPGVFETIPHKRIVNGALWTIPPELSCYVIMGGIILLRCQNKALALILLALALIELRPILSLFIGEEAYRFTLDSQHFQTFVSRRGIALVPSFLLGVAAYSLRYKIPYDARLLAVFLLLLAVAGWVGGVEIWAMAAVMPFICVMALYVVLFVGVTNFDRVTPAWLGDCSYGVYLYGAPIAQTSMYLFPGTPPDMWFFHFLAVAPAVILFATLSWRVVERPALRLRRNFAQASRERLEARAAA